MLAPRPTRRTGFTLVEMLVVIGVIVVLLGLLLVALGGVWKGGLMTKSMSNMRQISLWMQQYSSENRETILPSWFDYSNDPYPGKVRSELGAGAIGPVHKGTWTDILWTIYELSPVEPYRFDSPDEEFYKLTGGSGENPLRSAAANSAEAQANGAGEPTPFGVGALEQGSPGYFAANNFFQAVPLLSGKWYSTGQIRMPDRSMYLVDSFYGETIRDSDPPFTPANPMTVQVDFRYGDVCLMLMLDGHVEQQTRWSVANDLAGRGVRIEDLDQRVP